jgi:hypothetical protein
MSSVIGKGSAGIIGAEASNTRRCRPRFFPPDWEAALITWMLVVRVDDLVKDGAKRRRLRRAAILDKIINTNRKAVQAIKAAFSAPYIYVGLPHRPPETLSTAPVI